jgi:hypothetical protein
VAVTIVPVGWGVFGLAYLAAALPLGAVFVHLARAAIALDAVVQEGLAEQRSSPGCDARSDARTQGAL